MSAAADEVDEVEDTGYKGPAKKSVDEMKNLDADDEALNRWKAQLLQGADAAGDGPPVTVENMVVVGIDKGKLEGPPSELNLDLTDPAKLESYKDKSNAFVFKEGIEYRIKVDFKVNKEVVSGLKLVNQIKRKGIKVPGGKTSDMFGSYGPKPETQSAFSPVKDVPKGMMYRGHYTVHSEFVDDDKVCHLAWDWCFDIKKDWS
mmetsp:Transcript_31037/g.43434  ORF Transcript_31037/g.43434 Transcript_31037/m.43434 type:complete len:203 (-) Transcript_31037:86-694(-)